MDLAGALVPVHPEGDAGGASVKPGVGDQRLAVPEGGVVPSEGVPIQGLVADRGNCWQGVAVATEASAVDGLELLLVDWTFGTEELAAASEVLHRVESEPCVLIHDDDAKRLALSAGDRVRLSMDRGDLDLRLAVASNMARGVAVVPRHRRLAWQQLGGGRRPLVVRSIERKEERLGVH
jgi:hypothetical protein